MLLLRNKDQQYNNPLASFATCRQRSRNERTAMSQLHDPRPVKLVLVLLCSVSVISVSNEISDLCEISDLLLFVSYFASLSKGIKFGNYFFDVCCVKLSFLVRCQIPTTSYSTGITTTTKNIGLSLRLQLFFFF